MENGKKTEKHGKWETSTWRLKNDEITEKPEKWEMQTVRPGIWRENWKSQKMSNTNFRKWNMARKTEKVGKFRITTPYLYNKLFVFKNQSF